MIVRRCEPGDVNQALELARTFHAESPNHGWLEFDDITVRRLIMQAIDSPTWLPLVAYSQGQMAGIGLFFVLPCFFGPALEGGDLVFYVRPDRRGSLAAAAMMRVLVPWMRQQGVMRIRLGIDTGIDDARAEKFFAGSGFTRVGSLLALEFRPT